MNTTPIRRERTTREKAARRIAAREIALQHRHWPEAKASVKFAAAADVCARVGARVLVEDGDVEVARRFAEAWAMLRRRETRALAVQSSAQAVELKAVA